MLFGQSYGFLIELYWGYIFICMIIGDNKQEVDHCKGLANENGSV